MEIAKVKTEQSRWWYHVYIWVRRRWPVSSLSLQSPNIPCFFHPVMTMGSVSIVLLIFIGDKSDLSFSVLADQNVRLWV